MTSVHVDGRPLDPRTDLRPESGPALDWGYHGRGAPAQLALLAHHLGDDEKASRYSEHFLRCVVRHLPGPAWTLTGLDIERALPGPER